MLVIGWGGVDVGMVVRHEGKHGEPGVEFEEIAVVFVGFVDEELVAGVIGAGGGEAKGRADDVGGWDVQLLGCPDDHSGGGGFAVGAGYGHQFKVEFCDQMGREIVALGAFDSRLAGQGQLGVVGRQRRRVDEPIHAVRQFGAQESAVLGLGANA